MLLELLGGAAIGFVWGWLIGYRTWETLSRPFMAIIIIIIMTSCLAGEVGILGNLQALLSFLSASALALWICAVWQREIRHAR